ncbi:hypothetical protein GF362_04680 [Candidatus Dojkabacteria bacterium]|nr:hypothetical protein [Candidatus Dojkabacteria bacterium]
MEANLIGAGSLHFGNEIQGAVYLQPGLGEIHLINQGGTRLPLPPEIARCCDRRDGCPVLQKGLCTGWQKTEQGGHLFSIVHGEPDLLLNSVWYQKNVVDPAFCNMPPLPEATTIEILTGQA